ncbi:hypothetical protein IWQ62_003558 [Dispira parvispora]|uniref:Uncharacterized protein n=1 Tax=Dispira parvispora TaxID=1520584 RepID=A0A9W8E2T2_9FUNG|nr:hypothetical protein IWQ62_003558 [Dispira parvispora]
MATEEPTYYINKRSGNRFASRPDLISKFHRRVHNPDRLRPTVGHRRLHLLSHLVVLGVGYYSVFWMDYGPQDHCFTALQAWHRKKLDSFWSFNTEEKEELADLKQS